MRTCSSPRAPVVVERRQRGVDVRRVQGLVQRLQHPGLVGRVGLVDPPEEDVCIVADLHIGVEAVSISAKSFRSIRLHYSTEGTSHRSCPHAE